MENRSKLHLFKFDRCKSSPQIMETLTTALQYARMNEVSRISVDMLSDAGSFHCSGESSSPPQPQGD